MNGATFTFTCRSFHCVTLPGGETRITLENALPDASEDKLSLQEVATLLKKSVKQVDKLSRRAKDPLPLRRGKGRPFALRTELNTWLSEQPAPRTSAGQVARTFL